MNFPALLLVAPVPYATVKLTDMLFCLHMKWPLIGSISVVNLTSLFDLNLTNLKLTNIKKISFISAFKKISANRSKEIKTREAHCIVFQD